MYSKGFYLCLCVHYKNPNSKASSLTLPKRETDLLSSSTTKLL